MNKIKLTTTGGDEFYEISFGKYPGGEIYIVDDIDFAHPIDNVQAKIESSDDLMALLLLNNALDRQLIKADCCFLFIPYFPYARQDRIGPTGVNQSLSAEVIADIINTMNFRAVMISDPHSDVVPALVKNCQVIDQTKTIKSFFDYLVTDKGMLPKNIVLVAPDAGALKKTLVVAKEFGIDKVITAEKVRDMASGQITGTKINGDVVPGNHYVMVDDICDGGRTFIEIAKELRRLDQEARDKIQQGKVELYRAYGDPVPVPIPTTKIHLAVTHGIFSKGLAPLLDNGIDLVYAYNPWQEYVEKTNIYEYFRHNGVGLFGNTEIFFRKNQE